MLFVKGCSKVLSIILLLTFCSVFFQGCTTKKVALVDEEKLTVKLSKDRMAEVMAGEAIYVINKDGSRFIGTYVDIKDDLLFAFQKDQGYQLPLSEIDFIVVKRKSKAKTIGLVTAISLFVLSLVAMTQISCCL